MAETIYVRGEGGGIFAMDLPLPEAIADRLTKGLIRRVNEDGSPYTEAPPAPSEPEPSSQVPGLPLAEPAKSAPKAEWVGWAVVSGSTPEDAEQMTKTDLIEKYGAGGGDS